MLRMLLVSLLAYGTYALRLPEPVSTEFTSETLNCQTGKHEISLAAVKYLKDTMNDPDSVTLPKEGDGVACRIALLVPSLGGKKVQQALGELIQSAANTTSGQCDLGMYLAYDKGDQYYEDSDFRLAIQNDAQANKIEMHWVVNEGKKDFVSALNAAANQAYNDDWNYFYQIGDDVKFMTGGWDIELTKALKDLNYLGVVGPVQSNRNKKSILQQSFVSKLHICMFGYYFPPAFTNWYTDNWISNLYNNLNKYKQLEAVEVENAIDARYRQDKHMEKHWKELADESCQYLKSAMFSAEKPNQCKM